MSDKNEIARQEPDHKDFKPGEYAKYIKAYMAYVKLRHTEIKAQNKTRDRGRMRE